MNLDTLDAFGYVRRLPGAITWIWIRWILLDTLDTSVGSQRLLHGFGYFGYLGYFRRLPRAITWILWILS